MKCLVALVAFCCCFGSPLLSQADEPQDKPSVKIKEYALGKQCTIVKNSSDPETTETLIGTLRRFDDSTIVLDEARRVIRIERTTPILGQLPYLGKLFKNVGMTVEYVPGELSIQRSEVKDVGWNEKQ